MSFLGGGGTGKSFLIKTVSKWVEKILMKAGEANKIKVLLLAYTEVAASLIGMVLFLCTLKRKNIENFFTNFHLELDLNLELIIF